MHASSTALPEKPPPSSPPLLGMDWRELDLMIRDERKAGNPVACLIHSLQLESNRITLLLGNYLDDDDDEVDEEAITRPASKVQVRCMFQTRVLCALLSQLICTALPNQRGQEVATGWHAQPYLLTYLSYPFPSRCQVHLSCTGVHHTRCSQPFA